MFEKLIEACNTFLFGHQYPNGQLEVGSVQHRDLVRAFFAGALEGLILTGGKFDSEMHAEYSKMCDVMWIPDARFSPRGGKSC